MNSASLSKPSQATFDIWLKWTIFAAIVSVGATLMTFGILVSVTIAIFAFVRYRKELDATRRKWYVGILALCAVEIVVIIVLSSFLAGTTSG